MLIVDDDAVSLSALSRLLRHEGHDVLGATSVGEAFRLAIADPPDLLIGDLDLPDGDGCDLLRRIRLQHPSVRGIAISGFIGEEYERRCREAGYGLLLRKPVLLQQVLAGIVDRTPLKSLGGVPVPDPTTT
jgi:CheY-like chemotaxis protein